MPLLLCEVSNQTPNYARTEAARVLVVDDDPFMLKLVTKQLHSLGFTTASAVSSGAEATAAASASESVPDVILLDLNMPDMDGIEVLRSLGENKFAGDIILLSGEDPAIVRSAETLARAYGLSVLGTQPKPIDRRALSNLLSKHSVSLSPAPVRTRRQFTVAEVAKAIANGELVNHYQPKVVAETGEIIGVEALVRWQHPEAGLIYPDQFIPIAEAHCLIRDLTKCVIKSALAQASAWRRAGINLSIAINITMDDLMAPDFSTILIAMTKAADVPADSIVLEVTESQIMPDLRSILDSLTRLRLHRFGLSIDDFGTGHSSMTQLRDLPFDELKIDQSFTKNSHHDDRLGAFVKSTITLARNLGLSSVAEGVETAQEWEFLRNEGARFSQGYFIAKPMAAESIQPWMAVWRDRVVSEGLCDASRKVASIGQN